MSAFRQLLPVLVVASLWNPPTAFTLQNCKSSTLSSGFQFVSLTFSSHTWQENNCFSKSVELIVEWPSSVHLINTSFNNIDQVLIHSPKHYIFTVLQEKSLDCDHLFFFCLCVLSCSGFSFGNKPALANTADK